MTKVISKFFSDYLGCPIASLNTHDMALWDFSQERGLHDTEEKVCFDYNVFCKV